MQKVSLEIANTSIQSVALNTDFKNYLNANDIMVYSIYLPSFYESILDLTTYLSFEEKNRAERYYNDKDKKRFIICRSILKLLLASFTNTDAEKVVLEYNFNKKPYLPLEPLLNFNVSHSNDFATIAISQNELGVDIEYFSDTFNFNDIINTVFTENEIQNIEKSENKTKRFYELWTRKEAFVKAISKGIDDDFKNIPSLNGKYIIDAKLIDNTNNWTVKSFDIADDYHVALAFKSLPPKNKNIIIYAIPNNLKELIALLSL